MEARDIRGRVQRLRRAIAWLSSGPWLLLTDRKYGKHGVLVDEDYIRISPDAPQVARTQAEGLLGVLNDLPWLLECAEELARLQEKDPVVP